MLKKTEYLAYFESAIIIKIPIVLRVLEIAAISLEFCASLSSFANERLDEINQIVLVPTLWRNMELGVLGGLFFWLNFLSGLGLMRTI